MSAVPEPILCAWADVTPVFLTSADDAPRQVVLADFDERLYLAELLPRHAEGKGLLRMHRFSTHERTWNLVSEHTIPIRQTSLPPDAPASTDPAAQRQVQDSLPRLFATVLPASGTSPARLRLDITGPDVTASVVTEDGTTYRIDRADGGADSPLVALRQICLIGTEIWGVGSLVPVLGESPPKRELVLFRATSPHAAQWQSHPILPTPDADVDSVCATTGGGGQRFVAVGSPARGFQILRAESPADPNSTWQPVITCGAWKYSMNAEVFALLEFQGDLVVASGVTDQQQDRIKSFHRRGFELTSLHAAGDWDLLTGTPAYTPVGLRIPLSTQGPGLDDASSREVQAMIVHKDALHVASEGINGFKLWRSEDGIAWELLATPDLSGFRNTTVQSLLSASLGLARLVKAITPEGHTVYRLHLLL